MVIDNDYYEHFASIFIILFNPKNNHVRQIFLKGMIVHLFWHFII